MGARHFSASGGWDKPGAVGSTIQHQTLTERPLIMVALGIILLILGLIFHVHLLFILGIVLLLIGIVLLFVRPGGRVWY